LRFNIGKRDKYTHQSRVGFLVLFFIPVEGLLIN
jgi:hypothetical protein